MLETKLFELRDEATFIGVMATRMARPTNEAEWYLLSRDGYDVVQPALVMLDRISGGCSDYRPYATHQGGLRTFPTAHRYIQDHWDELESGQVIDVAYILGEKDKPKLSERITSNWSPASTPAKDDKPQCDCKMCRELPEPATPANPVPPKDKDAELRDAVLDAARQYGDAAQQVKKVREEILGEANGGTLGSMVLSWIELTNAESIMSEKLTILGQTGLTFAGFECDCEECKKQRADKQQKPN